MVTTVLGILTIYVSNQKVLSDVNVGSRCACGRSCGGLIVTDALLLVTMADNRPGKAQKCRLVILVPAKALGRRGGGGRRSEHKAGVAT